MLEIVSAKQIRALIFIAERERASAEVYEMFGDLITPQNAYKALRSLEAFGFLKARGAHKLYWTLTTKGRSELLRLVSDINAALLR